MIAAAVLSAGVTQAQKRIKETIAPTTEQVETQKKQVTENEYKVKGGVSFNYGFVGFISTSWSRDISLNTAWAARISRMWASKPTTGW